MKFISKLFAGAFALGLIGSAAAQTTTITITGSTAYRASTHDAIRGALSGVNYAYTQANPTDTLGNASQAIFSGTLGGQSVLVKTSWSGSVSGIIALRNSTTVNTLPDNTPRTPSGNALGNNPGSDPEVPDIAMSDVSHTSTPFTSLSLQERPVGVIPFRFVAGKDAPANLTNITTQIARRLWSAGYVPLAMATGNSTNRTTMVPSTFAASFFPPFNGQAPFMLYALGRDPGSGTRFLTFAETGVGVNSTVQQWQPTVSGNDVINQQIWPEDDNWNSTGLFLEEGNSGYPSGSALRGILRRNTTAGIGGVYVTVLGLDDAEWVVSAGNGFAGPGKTLTYNGVEYSPTAIREGQYTLWSYQQLINRAPLVDGSVLDNFIDAVVPVIRANDALIDTLQVDRNNDGSTVFPLYPAS